MPDHGFATPAFENESTSPGFRRKYLPSAIALPVGSIGRFSVRIENVVCQ